MAQYKRRSLSTYTLAGMALPLLAAAAQAQGPLRPPATPLVVRDPYLSTWQGGDSLSGIWPSFWTGSIRAVTGIARVDGQSYVFMGAPYLPGVPLMAQIAQSVTATQSRYTLSGGGVSVSVDFLSPVEPSDIARQSVPLSDIFVSARSADGRSHKVSLYFDISGEWASGDINAPIVWSRSSVASGTKVPLTVWNVTPANPNVLNEVNDSATWGQVLWATPTVAGLTSESGPDSDVRNQMLTTGVLSGTVDTNQPRPINDHFPVFAYDFNLGTVRNSASKPIILLLGNVRDPAVSYQGQPLPPLWKSYWPDWQHLLGFAAGDASAAVVRANALDRRITTDATMAGGSQYADLCALALRQAFGATQIVGTATKPWMFMKEISSSGNVSTVDVVYPSFPVFLYTNPKLLRMQLDPLFEYPESGLWPQPFAEHDLGAHYPNADGHNDGGGENMPVEESANMLIMAAAYMRYSPKADAASYAQTHYTILKKWADYLLTVPQGGTYPNALDPQFQNQTDDFTGPIAHSVNLALKGIIGVGAMGQIAALAGHMSDASHYSAASHSMITTWAQLSQSTTGPHLTLQYIEADTPQPAGWTAGKVGPYALSLHGGGASAEVPVAVINTAQSYTVAAWVKLSSTSGYQTVLSIDGSYVSGFFFQLRGDTGKFSLSALSQDSPNPGPVAVASARDAPAAGTWYHLAGVYDATAQTLSLYVNGQLQQTVPYTSAFQAGGHTAIGRGLYGGNPTDFVSGAIDDVRFYQSALSASDITAISNAATNTNPVAENLSAYYTFDEGAGTTAADSSGNNNAATFAGSTLDPSQAWSLKYNAFADKVLGLNLIPQSVLQEEAAFYKTQLNFFGVPLDPRHTYTKGDWELWTAGSTDDPALRQELISSVFNFADYSSFRGPFSDFYDTLSGQQVGFTARPVIGGVYAILDRTALRPTR